MLFKLFIIQLTFLVTFIMSVPIHINSNQFKIKNDKNLTSISKRSEDTLNTKSKCYCFYDISGVICRDVCKKVFYIKHWRTYLPFKEACLNNCSFTFIDN
jgi:hypothetical protein